VNDYDNGDLFGASGRQPMLPLSEAAYAIDAAIQQAAKSPITGLTPDEREIHGIHEFLGRSESHCAGEAELPRDPDGLLLDLLPVSTTSIDDAGRLQIEPDAASLQAWAHSDREAAEHLVSWVNACGMARTAIGNAIAGGSDRWDEEANRYENVLREAGYDRMKPAVQECDRELKDLHGAIQHAREVLDAF